MTTEAMPERTRRVLDDARGVRAMRWVIAIMLFLTVLGAALGLATRNAAAAMERQLVGRATVQIVAADPARRDREAKAAARALAAMPEVRRVTPVDRAQLARLLRPWLGDDGADPELPIPAMIDIDLSSADPAAIDRIAARVRTVVPTARVDAHEAWMSPVAGLLDLVVLLAAGIVLLLGAATAAVVVLAARAGLDAHRPTIEVMHMLGSTDVQIARLFQRRIARDAAVGGAVGAAGALATVALIGARASGIGSQLLGGASLGTAGWIVLAALPFAFVLLSAIAARAAITRALAGIL